MIGLTFNGKHSYIDFWLIMNYKRISTPAKKKIKASVPFMNGYYDFSTVATNGEIVYEERNIEVKFTILASSKIDLEFKKSVINQWLLEGGKAQLTFDDTPDIYFLAELEDENSLSETNSIGEFTVKFTADPFKVGKSYVGQEEWNNINFETDIIQDTTYNVKGTMSITIYNPGRIIAPEVIVPANMNCTLNGYTANFTTTKTKDYKFKLNNGYNTISVNGTGSIEIRFRKEVL
jgi:predicted phage tail component-like protein